MWGGANGLESRRIERAASARRVLKHADVAMGRGARARQKKSTQGGRLRGCPDARMCLDVRTLAPPISFLFFFAAAPAYAKVLLLLHVPFCFSG